MQELIDLITTQRAFELNSQAVQAGDQIMQNIHPQRWTDNNMQWWKELLLQNTKNIVKKAIFVGK